MAKKNIKNGGEQKAESEREYCARTSREMESCHGAGNFGTEDFAGASPQGALAWKERQRFYAELSAGNDFMLLYDKFKTFKSRCLKISIGNALKSLLLKSKTLLLFWF